MTTDYENQLEEEIISLKNLLDERTKQLDEAKKEIESLKPVESYNGILSKFGSSVNADISATVHMSSVVIGGEILTSQDIENLKHLWSLHMTKMNNKPLLYRLWRKIVSCLTMKKN